MRFERGNIVALLHDFDDFENVFGPSAQSVGVPRGDLVVDLDVVVVNPQGNALLGGGNAALQRRREDAAQLFDGFNRAVKHAHQFFALTAEVQAFITHAFCDLRLQIEQQAVFGCGWRLNADGCVCGRGGGGRANSYRLRCASECLV